jgi:hypothetical protein
MADPDIPDLLRLIACLAFTGVLLLGATLLVLCSAVARLRAMVQRPAPVERDDDEWWRGDNA